MTAPRFVSSDAAGAELPWQSVEELLDALEAGRLGADDYLFDAARQAWQPVRKHDGVVAAWDRRMGYRPPALRRPLSTAVRAAAAFPALDPDGVTPLRNAAVVRPMAPAIEDQRPLREPHRAEDPESPAARRWAAAVGVGIVVVLVGALLVGLLLIGRALETIAA